MMENLSDQPQAEIKHSAVSSTSNSFDWTFFGTGWNLIIISIALTIFGATILYQIMTNPRAANTATFILAYSVLFLAAVFLLAGTIRWGVCGAEFDHLSRIEQQNKLVIDMIGEQIATTKILTARLEEQKKQNA